MDWFAGAVVLAVFFLGPVFVGGYYVFTRFLTRMRELALRDRELDLKEKELTQRVREFEARYGLAPKDDPGASAGQGGDA